MHRTTPHLRFETRYDHILTPLRQRGMPAAIEILGALIYIHAPLPDGSHLQITSDGTLPSDPDAVRAWQAYRHHDDNPTVSALIYDSTTDGEHRLECGLRSPLFAAIDAFLAARGLVPTWRSEFRPVAVHVRHQGLTGVLGRPWCSRAANRPPPTTSSSTRLSSTEAGSASSPTRVSVGPAARGLAITTSSR
ncbi:hypothetical protein E6W39_29300 [Kitasatospora acidiphila]|uniref:Uncharacterized protein n=1 Tax=Kitasatospora acidiphila TaxID=2567942 RepID=A0A540W9C6_9ACTN|nr:hypothetical protein [Kitasatospora acidiphila]TQF05582.1 hypothetical protein E6W39_29300 [Kitasatospora acidiphila]